MLMISCFFIVFARAFRKIVKYAFHQSTDLCYLKSKVITAFISNFVLVLYLFEGTDRICEMIESYLRPLLIESNRTTIGIWSIGAMFSLVPIYCLCS